MPRIGQVAEQVGVRTSTIRYWEAHGLIKPPERSTKGYRLYNDTDVSILRFVRRAQLFGLSLAEIRDLLALHRQGKSPCAHVRSLARQHIRRIGATIEELQLLRSELQALARRRARRHKPGEVCPMIERGPTRRVS